MTGKVVSAKQWEEYLKQQGLYNDLIKWKRAVR